MGKKTTLAIGAIVVLGIASVGLQYVAPVYIEKNLRTALTDPQSPIRGEFSNFKMSLFGGTASAENVRLITADGGNYTTKRLDISGIDWLAVYGFNPTSDAISRQAILQDAKIERGDLTIATSAASLRGVHIDPSNWDPQTLRVEQADLTTVTETGNAESSKIASLSLQDVSNARFAALDAHDWHVDMPDPKARENGLDLSDPANRIDGKVADLKLADCSATGSGTAAVFSALFSSDPGSDDSMLCKSGALSQLKLTSARYTAAIESGTLDGLTDHSLAHASLANLKYSAADKGSFSTGKLVIEDLDTGIPFSKLGDNLRNREQASETLNKVRLKKLLISNQDFDFPEATLGWSQLALSDMGDGKLGDFAITDMSFKASQPNGTISAKWDDIDITGFDFKTLAYFQQRFRKQIEAQIQNPEAAMARQTLGEMGLPLSPPLFTAAKVDGMHGTFTGDLDFSVDLQSAKVAFDDIRPLENGDAALAFPRKTTSSMTGVQFHLPDEIASNPAVQKALGNKSINDLILDMTAHQNWDEKSGIYDYGFDQISLRDLGKIQLTFKLSGLTDKVMADLMGTRLTDQAALADIAQTKLGLAHARAEVSGDDFVPAILRVLSATKGIPPEQLQMTAGMVLLDSQKRFGETGTLGKSIDELSKWIAKPEHLVIELSPDQPVLFGALTNGRIAPNAMADLVDLHIEANQ